MTNKYKLNFTGELPETQKVKRPTYKLDKEEPKKKFHRCLLFISGLGYNHAHMLS